MLEDKKAICNAICEALRETRTFGIGCGNKLAEIRYVRENNGREFAVPIFEDGDGEPNESYPHGYYAVNITGDSGIAIWIDITNNFVKNM